MFNQRIAGRQPAVEPEDLMQEEEMEHGDEGMGFSAAHPGFDEEMWPGGPLKSQVMSWKKQFGEGQVFLTEVADDLYIWRTLNRFEYKAIVSTPGMDPLQREELIAETCVLWHPYGEGPFTYDVMAAAKAGVPARLAELVMEKSGFDRNTKTRAL